jgi:hypothetical protein
MAIKIKQAVDILVVVVRGGGLPERDGLTLGQRQRLEAAHDFTGDRQRLIDIRIGMGQGRETGLKLGGG